MSISLHGVFGPVTTPFRADGELDRDGFEKNVAMHIRQGLRGVVVSGSTGEAALLDAREREQLVDWARPHVPRDGVLIAGVGAESTRTTLKYISNAAERGADAVLVVAPHYFASAMTDAALRSHYARVADESRLPVILYNIPKYMHFRLSNALVAELARHPNVIGIKDSSGDKDSFTGYLSAQSGTFSVLTGNAQFWKTSLEMGARGGILAAGLFAAELPLGIMSAVQRADKTAADELQDRLSPLGKVIVGEFGVPGVKAALDLVGMRGGAPRLPLLPVTDADRRRVEDLLREAEQLASV